MAFDPIETVDRLDWCLQLSEETRRVLEEEGGISHHFMDTDIERATGIKIDGVGSPAQSQDSKRSTSSNSTVEGGDSEREPEDKNRLLFAVTGLLVVYALQNLGQDVWTLIAEVLLQIYGVPLYLAYSIAFGFLQGMMNMLGFLGGNIADGYTGRMEMIIISIALKILGGVFIFASAIVGDGLFDDDLNVLTMAPSSSLNPVLTVIGVVLLCVSGVGESSLEVLVGDQFLLSPYAKQRALGSLGWDVFVVVRCTLVFIRMAIFLFLQTYPEPVWSLPYLVFPTMAMLLLLLLKFTGVIRTVDPQGPRLTKVLRGIHLLMKTSNETEALDRIHKHRDSKTLHECSTAAAMSMKKVTDSQETLPIPSVEKNIKRYDQRSIVAREGMLPASAMDDHRERGGPEVPSLCPKSTFPRNVAKPRPMSRTTTLQRIQGPVDRALVDDIRQVMRTTLVIMPTFVVYYGVMDFFLNSLCPFFFRDHHWSLTTEELRVNLLIQAFVIPISVIVALMALYLCTSGREDSGIFSLTKILIGMSIGVLCLISFLIIEAVFFFSGYLTSFWWTLLVVTLPRVGEAVVMVGALQFLFSHSPPFLRCSTMGLMLFARGLGYMLSAGMDALLGGVVTLSTERGVTIRIIFHMVLIGCLCLSMVILYFTKRWYESLRFKH